jgi:hypothetical protein
MLRAEIVYASPDAVRRIRIRIRKKWFEGVRNEVIDCGVEWILADHAIKAEAREEAQIQASLRAFDHK